MVIWLSSGMRSRNWHCGTQHTIWGSITFTKKQKTNKLTPKKHHEGFQEGAEPLKSWACRSLTTSQGPPTPWLLLKKLSNPALTESAHIKETSMQNCWWPSAALQQKPYWPAAAQCGVLAAQQQTKRLFKESVTQHKKSVAASCPHWKTSPAQHEQSKEKGQKSFCTRATTYYLLYTFSSARSCKSGTSR